ncbi:SUN domain-containing protein 4 isoform X1 [Typha angustifolia]|uniref:SUN domain-containing protein 4 isoform X1 n=1 Tax=Typha angustifolia TaxID=59011 RepID=UPI003C3001B1
MQRSRRALLQRRIASENSSITGRKSFYKVSLSLVIASWVLIFFLNSFISHGNGYRDGQGSAVTESTWHEGSPSQDKQSDSEDTMAVSDTSFNHYSESTLTSDEETNDNSGANGEKYNLSEAGNGHVPEIDTDPGNKTDKDGAIRSDRLSRIAPGLDEFKSKAIAARGKAIASQTGIVIHHLEPGGKEYNYASASKGAKLLSFNKEAKGASNILEKNQDKYLRNPCSAEGKFVVIELSEETLVDTIEVANFEHYSSNLKDFELLSSLVYPTDYWDKIGNFTAANVKHAQRFSLPEPKWARYLKLNLLSHYGSEFYCTLSVVEIYGVDAVERMLEDLISIENKQSELDEQIAEQMPSQETIEQNDSFQELLEGTGYEAEKEDFKTKRDSMRKEVPDPIVEMRPLQLGRIPGDTVLKVLMQKVQSLDLNFAVLERYLEELNIRYGQIFQDFDGDIANKDILLKKIQQEIENLQISKDTFANEIGDILSWKLLVSSQLDHLMRDNAILRIQVETVRHHQIDMENKSLAVIFLSFIFGCLAIAKLFTGMVLSICRLENSENFCRRNSAWLLLLLSSSIISSILVI